FPKRKELIGQVSSFFMADVDAFVQHSFSKEKSIPELFHLLDEIKALQAAAKELTLNAEAFSTTRKQLSECWETIRHVIEDTRKKETEEKSQARQHCDEFVALLDGLRKKFDEKQISEKEAQNQLEGFTNKLKQLTHDRDDMRFLREKLMQLRDHLHARERGELEAQHRVIREQNEAKEKGLESVEKRVEELFRSA